MWGRFLPKGWYMCASRITGFFFTQTVERVINCSIFVLWMRFWQSPHSGNCFGVLHTQNPRATLINSIENAPTQPVLL
jgi:hypothetical protein